jgi:polyketide synthase PksR
MSISSACSSSLTAVHIACESLIQGNCSMAIAGGVNLTLDPSKYDALKRAGFLGSGNQSKSFGNGDGYIPGEGVGAVLLKPLSLAIEDGDRVLAVIKSSFANHSGGRQMYSAPDPKQQEKLIADCIRQSGINSDSIGYLESAANGSQLADPIEVIALKNAFKQFTDKKQFCAIGSVKSNLGHLEAASGISQLSKVILQLKHGLLVPTINADPLNPNIKLENSAFYLQKELKPWIQIKDAKSRKYLPRRSMINSFGAGGSYTSIIVEEFINYRKENNNGK